MYKSVKVSILHACALHYNNYFLHTQSFRDFVHSAMCKSAFTFTIHMHIYTSACILHFVLRYEMCLLATGFNILCSGLCNRCWFLCCVSPGPCCQQAGAGDEGRDGPQIQGFLWIFQGAYVGQSSVLLILYECIHVHVKHKNHTSI